MIDVGIQRPFHGKRLIFCEGVEDAGFLRNLRNERELGEFDIRVVQDFGGVSGNTGFSTAIKNSVTVPGFASFQHLVLVADCDEHQGKSFKSLCSQLRDANKDINVGGRFSIPKGPGIASSGYPRVTILLLPWLGGKGALETLLWEAMKSMPSFSKTIECVEDLCRCTGIGQGRHKWNQAKLDKARVHSALAVSNKHNPALGLSKLWKRAPHLIPVQNSVFDGIANALMSIK